MLKTGQYITRTSLPHSQQLILIEQSQTKQIVINIITTNNSSSFLLNILCVPANTSEEIEPVYK